MPRQSPPSRSTFEPQETEVHVPTDTVLAARRPSWTPPIPALAEPEARRTHNSLSQSKHHSRIYDDTLTPSLSVDWVGALGSLPKTRRPSFGPSTPEASQRARKSRLEAEQSDVVPPNILDSPEEGKGFRSSWEINVKKLVGDAVGNMSISPASRDIVLAARKGLFIIDLESRFSIPRFLPQGGTWDVADVQWNPHPSHAQYIVSTSSEKLLIWNLHLGGKTSIEHILRSHYRAITDINWHTTECDIVVSTGIDSWLWAWDLRTPRKPIFGLSSFQSGGTQVKWNYQDGNLLASSHSNEVLIWDRRKGSLPVTKIRAHTSKIYGIDWSRRRNEIVTCSLDKTIKTWDINSTNSQVNPEPKACIRTTYPVWRARNLPFGEGILSLPQRGETTLEMYGNSEDLIETFEGHSDVVKEFVWRKGNNGDFQLITWSKDRILRFWPIDAEVMHKVGHIPEIVRGRSKLTRNELEIIDTFCNPQGQEYFPTLSAPIGPRAILAEVRAQQPPRTVLTSNLGLGPSFNPPPTIDEDHRDATPTLTSPVRNPTVMPAGKSTGGTMSIGGSGLKSIGQFDQLSWLVSVKVGSKRGSNSTGTGSDAPSRLNSGSRPPSGPQRSRSEIGARQRSGSLSRAAGDEKKEGEEGQSLQDEITSVLTKLATSKIKLEKHDLTKRRTCTLGLHGPWGEKSSVFMRITFTFPREYPQASHPCGTPVVELERNPLISMKDRAYILKHLRPIRERKRPCLESCLRFLLFKEGPNDRDLSDSESSDDDDDDDDDEGNGKKSREITLSLLRSHKNLAEPRSSQGAFGPNGELISFFRAPPRIVHNILRGLTNPSSKNNESTEPFPPLEEQEQEQEQQQPPPQKASYLRSPALVSDAVRRLGLAATDRSVPPIDPKQPETSSNILRAMTNLLTIPQPKPRRNSDTKHSNDDVSKNYSVFPTRRSIVFSTSTNNIAGGDMKVAVDYVFTVGSGSLAGVCEVNAVAARKHGRYDHERVFRTLKTLFRKRHHPNNKSKKWQQAFFTSDLLAAQVITRLYWEFVKEKDVQMLAMLSMLVLQTELGGPRAPSVKHTTTTMGVPLRMANTDYFSLTKSTVNLLSPNSPEWPHLPSSPVASSMTPSFSSSNSSRGSWSSLFNTGTMRQFMNGVQDSLKEGLSTPTEIVPSHGISTVASRSTEKLGRPGLDLSAGGLLKRRMRQGSLLHTQAPRSISKSWHDGVRQPSKPLSASFSSAGHRQHLLRFTESSSFINEHQVVIFEPDRHEDTVKPFFDPQLVEQFKLNIYAYAELLFRWQLLHKRLELLKAVGREQDGLASNKEPHRIGLLRLCPRSDCRVPLPEESNICRHCSTSCLMPRCTICRFPVKGLSRTCLSCSHVTHISCWNSLDVTVPICPSGCGCFCTGTDGPFTRPSTRLGLTPPFPSMFPLPS